ncbi:hypothetical protein H0H93_009736 [Arthromyces matolae]|nr:hypothetical protein H0H93_009736 [Arthromyces matolae]
MSISSNNLKRKAGPILSPDLPTTNPNRKRTKPDSQETSSFEQKKDSEKPIISESRPTMLLQGAPILTINPEPLPTTFTRKFLNEVHGGSIIDGITYSKDESRLFLFLPAEGSPSLPTSPGNPGLLLTFRKAMLEQPVTLVIRVQGKPNEWMYFGEYSCTIVGQLTGQKFAQQDRKVKDSWVSLVCGSRWPEHEEILSRVLSWKKERNPNSTSSHELSIGREDIMAALEAGVVVRFRRFLSYLKRLEDADSNLSQKINAVRMECVAYDHEFVEDLRTKLETWTPAAKKGKKKRAF